MSSKNIKIINHTIGGNPFSDFKGVANSLKSVQNTLQTISSTLNRFLKIAQPFFSFLSQNPLTKIYKTILNQVEKTINTYISSGVGVILITPFNQKRKRKLKFKVDLLDPISELEQTVDALQKIDSNAKIQDEIKQKEKQIVTLQTNKSSGYESELQRVKSEINELKKQVVKVSYEDNYITKIDFEIPKLSAPEAITELIESFSNVNDPNRPKWNSANTVTGLGFLFSATTQVELLNNLNKLNTLFRLTSLAKSYDKFNKDIREWSATIENKAQKKEQKLQEDKLIVLLNSVNKENKTEADKQSMLKAMKDYVDTIYVEPIVSNITESDFPRWIPFTIEVLPYVREIRDTFLKLFDMLIIGTEAMDSVIKALVTTFIKKVNSFVKLLYSINNTINFLNSLQFALNATVIKINEDAKDKGGGVPYMVNALRTVQNFPANLFDLKYSTSKAILDEIKRLKQSEFSCLLFLATGSPNASLVAKEFKTLEKLFNIPKGSNITSTTKTSGQAFSKPDFTITPLYTDIKQIATKKDLQFTIIFNPLCVSFSYQLNCLSNNNYKSIVRPLVNIGANSRKTITFTNLLDNENHELIINFTDKNSVSYSRSFYFTTRFIFDNIVIGSDYDYYKYDNLENGSGSGRGDSITSDNGISIRNNNNSYLEFTIKDQNNQIVLNSFVLPKTENTYPIIGEDGSYEVQAFYENNEYISKKINKYSSFFTLKIKDLEGGVLYIKSSPFVFFFSKNLGDSFYISSDNLENPIFGQTDYFVSLGVGDYLISVFVNNKWIIFKIKISLSTNVSDFCLTLL